MPPAQQQQAAGSKRSPELADIFRAYGESYRQAHPLPRAQLKVMRAIESCRTAALGGHLQQCDACGYRQPAYNSCRNRHCPKCGSLAKAQWLEDRKADLLCDGSQWIAARQTFLFSVKALSLVFRGKFIDLIEQTFSKEQLQFPGRSAPLAEPAAFADLVRSLRQKPWVVYAKRPFSSPEKVLDYLGRYTHRVALSNNRILVVTDTAEGPRVTFSYRDRKHGNRTRTMTLQAHEFIRRFLLHVLPNGFMRIRHFGFLANRSRKLKLHRCRELLGHELQPSPTAKKSASQLMLETTGVDLSRCPACRLGTLVTLTQLPAIELSPCSLRGPPLDSS